MSHQIMLLPIKYIKWSIVHAFLPPSLPSSFFKTNIYCVSYWPGTSKGWGDNIEPRQLAFSDGAYDAEAAQTTVKGHVIMVDK